jgi:endonuclease/exonuclease/phosphatase family metal-dependent hydrolase
VTLQEVTVMTVDGAVTDQPADLARLTGRNARYGAVHAFPLVEPETREAVGAAMWGNAVLTSVPMAGGFTRALPRPADADLVEPPGFAHPLAGMRYGDTEPGHREARCVVGGSVGDVAVATTHLTYIGREQRARQVAAVRDAVASRPGPAVLAGDFNAAMEAPEVAPLVDGLVDAFAAVGIPPADDRRRSCGPWSIDHVFVRGLRVLDCRVVSEAGDLSDHLPVLAELAPA